MSQAYLLLTNFITKLDTKLVRRLFNNGNYAKTDVYLLDQRLDHYDLLKELKRSKLIPIVRNNKYVIDNCSLQLVSPEYNKSKQYLILSIDK